MQITGVHEENTENRKMNEKAKEKTTIELQIIDG